jgi:hypothetical protein
MQCTVWCMVYDVCIRIRIRIRWTTRELSTTAVTTTTTTTTTTEYRFRFLLNERAKLKHVETRKSKLQPRTNVSHE